jgi:hypothetical protein
VELQRFVIAGRSRKFARASRCGLAIVALAAVSVLCDGCQTRSTAASETAKAGPRASLAFCVASAQGCTPAATFSAANTKELTVRAWTIGAPPGNHTQSLMVMMPSGEEYPETRIGFRVLDGSKDAVPEMRTISMADLRSAQKHVTGSWTVRLLLDGKLLATETFEMKP